MIINNNSFGCMNVNFGFVFDLIFSPSLLAHSFSPFFHPHPGADCEWVSAVVLPAVHIDVAVRRILPSIRIGGGWRLLPMPWHIFI